MTPAFLRHWGLPAEAGPAWFEALVPLQYAAYPLRDVTGRPLGEANAPPELLAGVPLALEACPYPDSRFGLPMNALALAPVRESWPWVLASIAVLRAAWARSSPGADAPLDVVGMWAFSAACLSLPMFLVRTGGAEDGAIPVEVAALFKVLQGPYLAGWARWRRGDARPGEPLDPDEVVAHALANGGLHNPVGRVCPGPIGMIRQLVSAVVLPSGFRGPVDGSEALLAYGRHTAALSLERWLHRTGEDDVVAVRDALAQPLGAGAADRIASLQRRIAGIVRAEAPERRFDLAWLGRVSG